MEIVFATHNANKAKEIQSLMPDGVLIKTLSDIGCTEEIVEDALTLQGNAQLKADYVFQKYGVSCFADDTGLEIAALDGKPGVHSARYAGESRSDEANIQKVLEELSTTSNRSAQFRTVICLNLKGVHHFFEGIVTGEIHREKSGENGFGYDPIFEPEQTGLTFAQMTMTEKNKRSHRARAFEKMIQFFEK